MTPSIQEQRIRLKKIYESRTWDAKVDKMPDRQVQAVYLKFALSGQIKN